MSKISLATNAVGTAIFTIESPGTSTNRTLTLPDDTGTIVTNSGNQAGSFTTLNTSGAVVFNDAGADVDFRVEGDTNANLLFVDASTDRVGIGTNAPGSDLQIVKATPSFSMAETTSGTVQRVECSVSSVGVFNQNLNWNAGSASRAFTWSQGGTENMRIDSSGNVKFGTVGTNVARIQPTAGNALLPTYSFDASADVGMYCPSTNNLGLVTGQVERMRITSGGALLVNTTTSLGDSTWKFQVEDGRSAFTSVSNPYAIFVRYNSSTNGVYIGSGGADTLTFSNNSGATTAQIFTGGNFEIAGATATKASGTTWANPSDQRIKNNIRDYEKGLAELQQVRVREWEYNGKGGTTEGTKGLGVVADEIMLVLPNTVDTYEAKLNEDDEEATEIKRFDATEITWLLVNAVKELKAITDTQAQTIAALEARIAALETGV